MGNRQSTWMVTIAAALVLTMTACGSSDDVQISSSTQQAESAKSAKSTSPGDAADADADAADADAKGSGLERAGTPELAGGGRNDGPIPDQADIDAAPIGERGGQVFCDADRLWLATIGGVDDAVGGGDFVDTLLAAADVYTTWGERLPVDLAVVTVDMNVGFAEVVVTFGETQDPSATSDAYRSWRSGPAFADGRQAIDGWLADNC